MAYSLYTHRFWQEPFNLYSNKQCFLHKHEMIGSRDCCLHVSQNPGAGQQILWGISGQHESIWHISSWHDFLHVMNPNVKYPYFLEIRSSEETIETQADIQPFVTRLLWRKKLLRSNGKYKTHHATVWSHLGEAYVGYTNFDPCKRFNLQDIEEALDGRCDVGDEGHSKHGHWMGGSLHCQRNTEREPATIPTHYFRWGHQCLRLSSNKNCW